MSHNETKSLLLLVMCCFLEYGSTGITYTKPDGSTRISDIKMLARLLNDVIHLVQKKTFESICLVDPLFPFKDHDVFFQVILKTHQKMNNSWTVLTNDSFSSYTKLDDELHVSKFSAITKLPGVYIIPLKEQNDFASFNSLIEVINQNELFNPKALFILVKLISKCGYYDHCNHLVDYFSVLWKYNCMTAIVLIISKCDFEVTVATANAFSPQTQCQLANFSSINCYNFPQEKENFSINREEPRFFDGCNFVVATVPNPPLVVAKLIHNLKGNKIQYEYVGGVYIELMHLLSERLRYTLIFDQSHGYKADAFRKRLPNGTEVGIEVDTRNHKIDFFIGRPSSLNQFVNQFDYSSTFKYSNLVFFIPDPNFTPQWKIFFIMMSPEVWILINVTYFVVYIMYNLLDKLKCNRSVCKYTFFGKEIPTELFRSGLSLTSTLKPKSSYLRILYISWCVYNLHLTTSCSSTLFDLLKSPPLEKRILNIEDLKSSRLKVALTKEMVHYFKSLIHDRTIKSVLKNSFLCPSLELCVRDLLKYRNFTLVDSLDHFNYLVNLRKAKIHKINQYLLAFGTRAILSRGNPFSKKTRRVIEHAFEAGLIDHWESETERKFNFKKRTETEIEEHYIPLEFSDLKSVFILLLFGYIISLAIFTTEFFFNFVTH